MSLTTREAVFDSPEIDGVRRSFETLYLDELSDTYWKLIDRATAPGPMTPDRNWSVATKLHELSCREPSIEHALSVGADRYDTPDLANLYRSVISQIMELTGLDADSVHKL